MLRDSQKINKIKSILEKSSPNSRRSNLIVEMKDQISKGQNCYNCVGHCCTFVHNSMQVTPIEAVDAFLFLEQAGRIDKELIAELDSCIKHYRLDYNISLHSNKVMRRYYTCPFYKPGEKGCTLSLSDKPYGCLAFNPLEKNVSTEGKCASNIENLKNREKQSLNECELNKEIQNIFGLNWTKTSLPVALKEIIKLNYSI